MIDDIEKCKREASSKPVVIREGTASQTTPHLHQKDQEVQTDEILPDQKQIGKSLVSDLKYGLQKNMYEKALGMNKNLQDKLEEANKVQAKRNEPEPVKPQSVYYSSHADKEGTD